MSRATAATVAVIAATVAARQATTRPVPLEYAIPNGAGALATAGTLFRKRH